MTNSSSSWAVGLLLGALAAGGAGAAPRADRLITPRSVGPVRVGMTVAQARRVLPGTRFKRLSDGEGIAYIGVMRGKRVVMQLFAGEDDPKRPIDARRKVQIIDVYDAQYRTAAGIYPGMRVSAAERRLGKLKEIELTEIEAREYATFTRPHPGFSFQVLSPSGWAGNYGRKDVGPRASTRKYVPTARIGAITVSGG